MSFSFNGIPIGNHLKPKRSSFGIGSFLALLLFGTAFIAVGYLFLQDTLRSYSWPTTNGTVISVDEHRGSDGTTYTPTVDYVVNGTTYTTTPNYSSGSRDTVGESKEVHYNPNDPSDGVLELSGGGFFIYLFPIIGIVIVIASIVSFIMNIARTGSIKNLKQSGIKVTGIATSLGDGTNSSSQLVVIAADGSGQPREFISDSFKGATGIYFRDLVKNPVAIDVYIDPMDSSKYYVDLDDLPALSAGDIMSLVTKATAGQIQNPLQKPENPVNTPVSPPKPETDPFPKQ